MPLVTLGFGTVFAFTFAAIRLRSWLLGLATAGYAAALTGVFALTDHHATGGRAVAYNACLVVMWLVGSAHALAIRGRIANASQRDTVPAPEPDMLGQIAARERTAIEADPALRQAIERRERRSQAREILARDPDLATELGIGRPDLKCGFDDGGLVDVNHVPVVVLADLPGLDAEAAERVVAARERLGGLGSGADLVVSADIPNDVVDALADRLVFRAVD